MTLLEMLRFDYLRYNQKRTIPEQVEYDTMLERVIKGKDGLSEFDTSLTAGEIEGIRQNEQIARHQLCASIVTRLKADCYVYGPKVAETLLPMIIAALKK